MYYQAMTDMHALYMQDCSHIHWEADEMEHFDDTRYKELLEQAHYVL